MLDFLLEFGSSASSNISYHEVFPHACSESHCLMEGVFGLHSPSSGADGDAPQKVAWGTADIEQDSCQVETAGIGMGNLCEFSREPFLGVYMFPPGK